MERISFQDPLRGVLHTDGGQRPTILMAHGFKGFMDWGMFPWICDRLAEEGFAAVRFDFALNGVDHKGDFSDLDAFRRNTLTQEQKDLEAIVNAVAGQEGPFRGCCRADAIGLAGHSRGGGGVVEYGAADPRVSAVAGLAAVAEASRFPQEAREEAERTGSFGVLNARTKQVLPVGIDYFRDAESHDICGAAGRMSQPLLVIHGEADEAVPAEHARRLAAAAGDRATLELIPGTGHTFGAVHPFAGPTPALERVVDRLVHFFRAQLPS